MSLLVVLGVWLLKAKDERRRVSLLSSHLRQYAIESLLERITQGYLRALDESDPERRQQIWSILSGDEQQLSQQLARLANALQKETEQGFRMNRWSWPFLERIWPGASIDFRRVMSVHAQRITHAVSGQEGASAKDRAFTVMAEILLMQHSCHWFCRSKNVASARLLARHQTAYDQVLRSVTPDTRQGYLAALQGR